MGNTFSRRRRTRDYQQQAPLSRVPTSVSTSQTFEDEGLTQGHTHQSKIETVSENKESLTILTYQDQLINAISVDTQKIAEILREGEFISDESFGKSLRPSSTPKEKAAILVTAVGEKIKNDPKQFPDLIRVFSEQVSTKDIAERLQSAYQDRGSFASDSHASQPRHTGDIALPSVYSKDANQPVADKPQDAVGIGENQPILSNPSMHQLLSVKDESVQTTSESIAAIVPTSSSTATVDSPEPAYKAMIHCHNKLVTALSTDVVTISGVLLETEFIPSEISSKMLLPNSTPKEKATILVNAITDKIKIAPKRFYELIKVFSEQIYTKRYH